jgi:hypothetical protein
MIRRDRRGTSTAVGYALTLGIATLLVTGLVVAGGTFLEQQREETIRDEMTVIGQQLAADIGAADRLARTEDVGEVRIRRSLPDRVVGSSYNVELRTDNGEDRIHLVSADPAVTVVVDVETSKDLDAGTVQGGAIEIVYDLGDDHLEVQNG